MPEGGQILVAYYRVSTHQQGQSGLGLEAQQAAVAAHVQTTDQTLLAEYTEVESGKKVERPQLTLALARCRETSCRTDPWETGDHALAGSCFRSCFDVPSLLTFR